MEGGNRGHTVTCTDIVQSTDVIMTYQIYCVTCIETESATFKI